MCEPSHNNATAFKVTSLWQYRQVAQLWQRKCAKLALFSINVQRYSLNHIITFFEPPYGASKAILALRSRENVSFVRKTAK